MLNKITFCSPYNLSAYSFSILYDSFKHIFSSPLHVQRNPRTPGPSMLPGFFLDELEKNDFLFGPILLTAQKTIYQIQRENLLFI